jgi:hypothetical protein
MTAATLPSLKYRRYVLSLLAIVYAFNFTDRQILAILLQAMVSEPVELSRFPRSPPTSSVSVHSAAPTTACSR